MLVLTPSLGTRRILFELRAMQQGGDGDGGGG